MDQSVGDALCVHAHLYAFPIHARTSSNAGLRFVGTELPPRAPPCLVSGECTPPPPVDALFAGDAFAAAGDAPPLGGTPFPDICATMLAKSRDYCVRNFVDTPCVDVHRQHGDILHICGIMLGCIPRVADTIQAYHRHFRVRQISPATVHILRWYEFVPCMSLLLVVSDDLFQRRWRSKAAGHSPHVTMHTSHASWQYQHSTRHMRPMCLFSLE